jgi:hypothetical protein
MDKTWTKDGDLETLKQQGKVREKVREKIFCIQENICKTIVVGERIQT